MSLMFLDLNDKKLWMRPFHNAGKLLMGRSVQGILSIGYIAFATRALGVTDFGILVLIHSTIFFLRQLLGFQSWQMIMRYGAGAMDDIGAYNLKRLAIFALKIEFAAAAIGVLFIQIFSKPALELFGVPVEFQSMLEIYSILLVASLISDVGLGILRLFDRHDLISWQMVVTPLTRFVCTGILLILGGGLWSFVIVWLCTAVLGKIVLLGIGIWALRQQIRNAKCNGANGGRGANVTNRLDASGGGLWRYVIGTNLHSSLGVDVAPMLISTVLGPAGAGLWRIAQKFAGIVGQPVGKLLLPAVYTDMAWLNVNGTNKQRRDMVFKTGLVAGGLSLLLVMVMVLGGEWLIRLVAGDEFLAAYSPMVILTLSVVCGTFTFGIGPLLMTAGRVWQLTAVRLVTTALFFASIVPMVELWGILGAAFATAGRSLANVGLSLWVARDLLTKSKNPADHPET